MNKESRRLPRDTDRFRYSSSPLKGPSSINNVSLEDISAVQIKNFKSIVDEKIIFDQATFISGFNSAGKSSFSHALLLILQWLGSLTSAQPSKIPINGPLIQLGNSAMSMLNRSVLGVEETSPTENYQPFEVALTWNDNIISDYKNVTFKLNAESNSRGYFDLEEVVVHESHKTEKGESIEKTFRYRISNESLLDEPVLKFLGKYVSANFTPLHQNLKVKNEITRINKELAVDEQIIEKYPYYQVITKQENNSKSITCLFPNKVKITENHKPFDTGMTKDPKLTPLIREKETSLDNSFLIPRDDAFRFLIFKRICENINETPEDMDVNHKLSEQILSLKLGNVSTPETSSKKQLDEKLNFDINEKSLLFSVAESLRPYADIEEVMEKFENSFSNEKIPSNLDSLSIKNENEYIDAMNLRELVSLINITAKKTIPYELGRIMPRTMKLRSRSGTSIFNNTLREFHPNTLSRTLSRAKDHKSIDEGDAWSDEFRDLLFTRINITKLLEPLKTKKVDEELEESDLEFTERYSNFGRNNRIERGIKEAFIEYLLPNNPENKKDYVYDPYEKKHQLTLSLPEKIGNTFKLFQNEFLNETKKITSELDAISETHMRKIASEVSSLSDKIGELNKQKSDNDETLIKLRDKRTGLETFVNNESNPMSEIEEKYQILNGINKEIENIRKSSMKLIKSVESNQKKLLADVLDFQKSSLDFSETYIEFDEFINQKSKNILNNILENSKSEVEKLENYVFLKLLIPPLDSMESRRTQNFYTEYQNFFIKHISNINHDKTSSNDVKQLIKSKNLILFKDEHTEKLSYSRKNNFEVTLFGGGNEFFNNFNYLSSTRNLSKNNMEGFYGGNSQSPLGSNAEYLANFININGEEEYIAPLPQKYLDSLDQNGLESTAPYLLPLNQHINIWSSFIFNREVEIGIDENRGLTLMIGNDAIQNVGSGVSQVLPIITQLIVSDNNFVLLEEAEQNLHPEAQANLADMIITFSRQRRKILVETHSDHLVNRIRLRMITDETTPGAKIYFAQIDEKNGTKLKEMQINEKGEFITDKIPDGFFDQPQKDTLKIIKAIKDKK